MRPVRSWLFLKKTAPILRIPAGDPVDGQECDCGNFLLTEDSDPILTEDSFFVSPEG